MTRNQFAIVAAGVLVGSALGGMLYHALSCRQCRDCRKKAADIAKASAEMAERVNHD